MRQWKQDQYFDSREPGNPHPNYGGCDAMGPDGTCCECQEAYGHPDGSVSDFAGKVLRKAPITTRLKRAWAALRQVPRALQ